MKMELTNAEIILGVFASIVSIFWGLLAYSSTRGKAITDLAKEIGAVKATLEDTMSNVKELRNDIRATNASIDTRATESKQDTNSVRMKVQSVSEESAIAYEGIRGNISEVRKEFREDIKRLEDKITDGFKEIKEIMRDSQNSNKESS